MKAAPLTSLTLGALVSFACTTNLDGLTNGEDVDASLPSGDAGDASDEFPPPDDNHSDPPPPGESFVEPNALFALTLLHGVVDSPLLFFCFADETGTLIGNPIPEGGLAFGKSLAVRSIAGLNLTDDTFQPFVIAAREDVTVGKDCRTLAEEAAGFAQTPELALVDGGADASLDAATIDAGDATAPEEPPEPPPFRVASLPLVPKGTLSKNGSYLLTATGCVGGPAFTSPIERSVCGASYTPNHSTLSPMLVRLSQISAFGAPSLQFLQASVATVLSRVSSVPGPLTSGQEVTLVSDVISGAILPYPPLRSVPLSTFGSPFAQVELQIEADPELSWRQSWGAALEQAGLETLGDGSGYTLVLLGANPWVKSTGFWNKALITLLPNTPTTP